MGVIGIQSGRHLWEAARLGIGDCDFDKMQFPALKLKEAIPIFTERVYGRRLSFGEG